MAQLLGIHHHRFDFLDAAEHRAEGNELEASDARNQLGQGGLADAGRSPENDGGERVLLDLAAQRLAGPQDVLLPDIVFQPRGTHPFRQGPVAAGRLRCGGVKQAHARNTLCRGASYRRIPAATAALRDSTPTVGMEMSIAADRSAPLTPCASLPMIRLHLAVKSTAASERTASPARAGTPA